MNWLRNNKRLVLAVLLFLLITIDRLLTRFLPGLLPEDVDLVTSLFYLAALALGVSAPAPAWLQRAGDAMKGDGGFSRVGLMVVALLIGAMLMLASCAGGELREDAKPWVSPVVDELCVPACQAAQLEAVQAAALIEDDVARMAAKLAAGQAHQWCLFGCELAAAKVAPAE